MKKTTGDHKQKTADWSYIDDSLKNRLRKNSFFNMLNFLVTLPLLFIITPLILKFVGKEVYGIWSLTATIIIFAELFGGVYSPTALGIVVPKFNPKKQAKDINEIINTLFVFYLGSAVVMFFIYLLAEGQIIKLFFKVGEPLIPITKFVLGVSFYLFLVNFVLTSFAYMFHGFNILYPAHILHSVMAYLRVGCMIGALFMGYGIKGIVIVQMASIFLETTLLIIFAKRVFPPLAFNPKMYSFAKLKMIFSLSVKLMFTRLSLIVNQNVDKLILGYFINPVMVAYYQIGASITKYISQVPGMLSSISLIQAVAELKNKDKLDKVYNLYDRTNKYIFFIALLLASGIVIFGKEFLFLWLGQGYTQAYVVLVFLSFSYTYSLVGIPVMYILNGLEKVNGPMIIAAFTAVLNIVLSIILTKSYGLLGALSGTAISMFIGTSVLYIMFIIVMKHHFSLVKIFLKPIISILIAFFCVHMLQSNVDLAVNWLIFAAKVAGYSALYIVLNVFILKQFDNYDVDLLRGFVPFLKKKH